MVLVRMLRNGTDVLWNAADAMRDRQCWPGALRLLSGTLARGPTQTDIITVYARFSRDAEPGRPVEVCYAWTGGDSHVALVSGYSVDATGGTFVKVNDPADNIGLISFASLQTAYGLGTWVETFVRIQ